MIRTDAAHWLLASAVKHRRLRTAVSPALPGGKKFVHSLYRFLHKHGYDR